ncbi:MAG: helix-hairpin-helix domain-containing protein [Chloroflexi bacterium]|nr:helix-hairpin-helix domain-containing protein [Chloroflexota bacterium]
MVVKVSQSNVGVFVLGFVLGMIMAFGGMALLRRTQPAPIVIVPPAPTNTPAPTATPGPIQVYVNGAVAHTAVYTLPPDSAIEQAIAAAGGFAPDANTAVVNLAQPLFHGAQVYVPTVNEVAAMPTAVISAPGGQRGTAVTISDTGAGGLVNINQASAAELETLPGIGPSTAASIIEYRTNSGLFNSIEEIMNVPGIGEGKFEQIKELIMVGQ